MACSTHVEVFAAAARGSCDFCMLCAHTSLLHPPSVELCFNHSPPPSDGLRAVPAEHSIMHGHNFSAPAAQSDELRPVAAPQGCGRACPSCRARPHTSISAAAHPGGSAPRIPTYSTAQEHIRAFQPDSTADMRLLLVDPAPCRSTAASEPRKAAYPMAPTAPELLGPADNSTDIA